MSEAELPDGWTAKEDQLGASPEYNPRKQPMIRYEHDSLDLWITVERGDPTKGLPRDIPRFIIDAGLNATSRDDPRLVEGCGPAKIRGATEEFRESTNHTFNNSRTAARYFTHLFEDKYAETDDEAEAFDYAMDQIKE